MDQKPALLLVSADVRVARLCQQAAIQLACDLVIASDTSNAEAALSANQFGVALIDADTNPQYLDLTRQLKERSARIQVVISQARLRFPQPWMPLKQARPTTLKSP
ncbi:MAG TPA: hypothetical protein VG498_00010 [Terriglobales bacterium]|nr:hypothetical protein [Terriglobales bacterium]